MELILKYEDEQLKNIDIHQQKYDSIQNYFNKIWKEDINSDDMAKKIFNQIDNINDDGIYDICKQCFNINQLKSKLLLFELEHYKETSVTCDLNKFKDKALSILKRYQYKAGGELIEDIDWVIHLDTSDQFNVLKNEILFVNTLPIYDYKDDVLYYMELIKNRLDDISSNIDVKLKFKKDNSNKIYWIILKCIDYNVKEPSIGL